MRVINVSLLMLTLAAGQTIGQTTTNASATTETPSPAPINKPEPSWSYSVSVYNYVVPDDRSYVQPTITLDRGPIHLEARYNYEGLDTGSLWVGYNFTGGNKIAWALTPMIGGVFGDTSGIAPGYRGSVSWWRLELYSEGEYVYNTDDSSDSFFYNWSELTVSLMDWLRVGFVTQRTQLYQTDRDVQRGLLLGATFKRVDISAYVLNPDNDNPVWVFQVGVGF